MANPVIVQSKDNEGPNPPTTTKGNSGNILTTTFTNQTVAKNAILAFATFADSGGVHNDYAASDTQGNSYSRITQANTGGSGTQSIVIGAAYNIAGDPTTGETVSTFFSTGSDTEDFWAAFIMEIGNVISISNPIIGSNSNAQNGLANGTNNITSGSVTVTAGQVPAIMVACCCNTDGSATPTVGTGMTLYVNDWAFFTATNNATFAYQILTTAGTYSAIFNQNAAGTSDIGTSMIVLQGNASPGGVNAGGIMWTSSF